VDPTALDDMLRETTGPLAVRLADTRAGRVDEVLVVVGDPVMSAGCTSSAWCRVTLPFFAARDTFPLPQRLYDPADEVVLAVAVELGVSRSVPQAAAMMTAAEWTAATRVGHDDLVALSLALADLADGDWDWRMLAWDGGMVTGPEGGLVTATIAAAVEVGVVHR
jgi:hypothetical protein